MFNAGNQHTFYATWIRSIYTAVSGEVIVFEVPNESSIPRNDDSLITDNESTLQVFPNPTTDDINISGLSNDMSHAIKIYDITGIVVKELVYTESSQKIKMLDLPDGVYVLQVFNTDKKLIQTFKIIKMQ